MSEPGLLALPQLQSRILIGGFAALVLTLSAAIWAMAQPVVPATTVIDAMKLAAQLLLIPGLCLLAGVQFAASWRFGHRDDNAGSPETASQLLDIALRYNRNTLEQGFLAATAWLGLAASHPERALVVLPVLAALFGFGRITFWLGYAMAPWARSFGFVLTHMPTAAVLLVLAAGMVISW